MIRPDKQMVAISGGGTKKTNQQASGTTQNLKRGDTGSAVSTMQQGLVNAGYQIDVDGSFGPKTESALKQFQKDNGLSVDGIFGSNSAGVLYGGKPGTSKPAAPSKQQSQEVPAPAPSQNWEAPKPDGAGAAQVNAAYNAAMAAIENAKAGSFTSPLDKTISDLYGQITGREPFSYNAADDPVYAQYAAMYARNGRQAMEDTMGQAAALTGGYGSSYAQAAGQGAYNAYMEKLNDILPQLEQNAYARYQDAGDELMQRYQMASDMRGDQYEQWVNDRDWNYGLAQDAYDRYLDARDWQYRQDQDAYDKSVDERDWQYKQDQDAYERYVDERNWKQKLEQEKYDREQDALNWQYKLSQGSDGGNGGTGGNGGGTNPTTLPQEVLAVLETSYTNKKLPESSWNNYAALYGADALTAAGYSKDTGTQNYTVTNTNAGKGVIVPGKGTMTWAELEEAVNSGQVVETIDDNAGTVTYTWLPFAQR